MTPFAQVQATAEMHARLTVLIGASLCRIN